MTKRHGEGSLIALKSAIKKFLVLILLTVIGAPGCSSPGDLIGPWRSKPVLKKRITVVPFIDFAGLGASDTERITEQVVEMLSKSPNLVIYPCPLEIAALSAPEKRGAMVEKAGELGFNALIIGQLNPHEIEIKKKGLWPFKRAVSSVHVSLFIDVLETTTGTLLLTLTQREEVELGEGDLSKTDETVSRRAWEKALPKILEDPVERVLEALENLTWIGRIIEVNGGDIKIDGGSDIGIIPLSIFEVFSAEEFVIAKDGRRYPTSWKRIGKIQVKEVRKTTSLAAPLKGGPFLPGQSVTLSD